MGVVFRLFCVAFIGGSEGGHSLVACLCHLAIDAPFCSFLAEFRAVFKIGVFHIPASVGFFAREPSMCLTDSRWMDRYLPRGIRGAGWRGVRGSYMSITSSCLLSSLDCEVVSVSHLCGIVTSGANTVAARRPARPPA